jgi:hypothetical protein
MASRESIIACEVQPGGEPSSGGLPMELAEKLQDFGAKRRQVMWLPEGLRPAVAHHCPILPFGVSIAQVGAERSRQAGHQPTLALSPVPRTRHRDLPRFDFGHVVSSDAICRQTTLQSVQLERFRRARGVFAFSP